MREGGPGRGGAYPPVIADVAVLGGLLLALGGGVSVGEGSLIRDLTLLLEQSLIWWRDSSAERWEVGQRRCSGDCVHAWAKISTSHSHMTSGHCSTSSLSV